MSEVSADDSFGNRLCGRRISKIEQPPDFRLKTSQIFRNTGTYIDIDRLRSHFEQEGLVSIGAACRIITECSIIIKKEPNLLRLSAPLTVVGDIHGQYFDLLRIFQLAGPVRDVRYLFLGDYVDRGSFSIECLLYLCALKIVYPRNIFLLRGNHECRRITRYFTYRSECILKLNSYFYDLSCTLFDYLPLAAIMNNQFLCIHGCISSEMKKVEDICKIDRFVEIPHKGIMCDLMWSDPSPNALAQNEDEREEKFSKNHPRGCAQLVSQIALCSFLNNNKLVSIIRGHQVAADGVMFTSNNPQTGFPALITVFSAPNYCDVYKNKGAILVYDGCNLRASQFAETKHPFVLPNFLNIFTWAIPFLISQVNEMLVSLSKEFSVDDDQSRSSEFEIQELVKKAATKSTRISTETGDNWKMPFLKLFENKRKRTILQQRAVAAESVNKKLMESRNQSEVILKLGGITPRDYKVLSGSETLKGVEVSKDMSFKFAQTLDESNERWME